MVRFTVTENHLLDFERLIRSEFSEFSTRYQEQFRRSPIEKGRHGQPTVRNPVWTCYVNGSARGVHVDHWEGIFRRWMRTYPELGLDSGQCSIEAETWYRVDQMLLQGNGDRWWPGT